MKVGQYCPTEFYGGQFFTSELEAPGSPGPKTKASLSGWAYRFPVDSPASHPRVLLSTGG